MIVDMTRKKLAWRIAGLLALLLLMLLCALASLIYGTKTLPLAAVWNHFINDSSNSYNDLVINARETRTLTGLIVGAALAVSGAVSQGLLRNPLGEPGLLGVNAGASAIIVSFSLIPTLATIPRLWPALIGAILATLLFYLLGGGQRNSNPARLVLTGAAINACLFAFVQSITLLNPNLLESYRFWMIGSLIGLPMQDIITIIPYFIIGLILIFSIAASLNVLAFEVEIATSMGANIIRIRILALTGATLLAATATAMAGPIAFIGLAAPHLVRAMIGGDFRWLLPYCVVVGPILLLSADIIARLVMAPSEVMVGIITAALGGPLLYATVNSKKGTTYVLH